MFIQEMKGTLQDQAHIFQDAHFYSFQIHQLTIICCFEHTNHDILLNFLFQNLQNLTFCLTVICISNIFHI